MKDRFSDASAELTDANPYVCEICTVTYGHETIEHRSDDTLGHGSAQDPGTCLINCDPMPFGD